MLSVEIKLPTVYADTMKFKTNPMKVNGGKRPKADSDSRIVRLERELKLSTPIREEADPESATTSGTALPTGALPRALVRRLPQRDPVTFPTNARAERGLPRRRRRSFGCP